MHSTSLTHLGLRHGQVTNSENVSRNGPFIHTRDSAISVNHFRVVDLREVEVDSKRDWHQIRKEENKPEQGYHGVGPLAVKAFE